MTKPAPKRPPIKNGPTHKTSATTTTSPAPERPFTKNGTANGTAQAMMATPQPVRDKNGFLPCPVHFFTYHSDGRLGNHMVQYALLIAAKNMFPGLEVIASKVRQFSVRTEIVYSFIQ